MQAADSKTLSAAAAMASEAPSRWRALSLFGLYHLALGIVVLLVQGQHTVIDTLTPANPVLFRAMAWLFVAAAPVILFFARLRRPPFALQIDAVLLFDIATLTLLLHAGGGVDSGAGLLLAVSLAIGLPLTGGVAPFLFAALASSAVISGQAFLHLAGTAPLGGYVHAGLLGAAFFSIALLDYTLSRRLKVSEAKIREQEIHLEDLNEVNAFVVGLLDVGVVVVDGRNRVRMLNLRAERWLSHDSAIQLPLPLAALSPEISDCLNAWRTPGQQDANCTSELSTATGDYRIEFVTLGGGTERAAVVLIRDLEKIRAESHKAQLAAIGQMSASIAHEIRNPLSSISQAAQLLREDDGATERQRRVSTLILRNSERLNTVVDNVLALARRRDPSPQAVALCRFAQQVAAQLRAAWATGTAIIDAHCHNDVQASFDPGHLEQVLVILCENAVRHAEPADERLRVELIVGTGDDAVPVLDIVDNGEGIAPDVAGKIFEPFFSSGDSAGLGLFLARQLCELNGARLTLARRDDLSGACFRIHMPPAA